MADEGMGTSWSARRRAAKKARDAASEELPQPPQPEVKKADPAPKAKAKAEPARPAAEPTAQGKAKVAPTTDAEPAPAAPKTASEPKGTAGAKKQTADGRVAAKPKVQLQPEVEEEKPPAPQAKTTDFSHTLDNDGKGFADDGKDGDREVSTSRRAKQERMQKKCEEMRVMEDQVLATLGGEVAPGAAAAGSGGAVALHSGCRVLLTRLQARQELNGMMGTLVTFDAEKGRWAVKLDNGEGVKLFKVANLEVVLLPDAGRLPARLEAAAAADAQWSDSDQSTTIAGSTMTPRKSKKGRASHRKGGKVAPQNADEASDEDGGFRSSAAADAGDDLNAEGIPEVQLLRHLFRLQDTPGVDQSAVSRAIADFAEQLGQPTHESEWLAYQPDWDECLQQPYGAL